MAALELYDRRDCPYSKRVREKLNELDLDYEETIVPDRHTEREDLHERTGQRGVPVLFDPGLEEDWLGDSDEIVAHLEDAHE